MRTSVGVWGVATAWVVLGGCIRPGVAGKVVEGPGSERVMFAGDRQDERLTGPGLPGATLVLKGVQSGSLERTIATGTSDAQGEFKITFPRTLQGETMRLEASCPGHAPTQGQVGVTEGNRRVLVILKRIGR